MIPQSSGPAGRWPVDRRKPMQCAVQWGVSGGQSCSCRARDPRGGGRPVIALQTAAQLNCRWRAGPLGRPPAATVLDFRLGAEDSAAVCRRFADLGIPFMLYRGFSYREAIGRQSRPARGSGASKAGRRAGPGRHGGRSYLHPSCIKPSCITRSCSGPSCTERRQTVGIPIDTPASFALEAGAISRDGLLSSRAGAGSAVPFYSEELPWLP
jgi:hypothetical protein